MLEDILVSGMRCKGKQILHKTNNNFFIQFKRLGKMIREYFERYRVHSTSSTSIDFYIHT